MLQIPFYHWHKLCFQTDMPQLIHPHVRAYWRASSSWPMLCFHQKVYTPLKTNIASEKWCLENYYCILLKWFPFHRTFVQFRGVFYRCNIRIYIIGCAVNLAAHLSQNSIDSLWTLSGSLSRFTPEKWWLEDKPFLLGMSLFRGYLLNFQGVSRIQKKKFEPKHLAKWFKWWLWGQTWLICLLKATDWNDIGCLELVNIRGTIHNRGYIPPPKKHQKLCTDEQKQDWRWGSTSWLSRAKNHDLHWFTLL